jgi:hypothetical protein
MKKTAFMESIAIMISEIYMQSDLIFWKSSWKNIKKHKNGEKRNGKKGKFK